MVLQPTSTPSTLLPCSIAGNGSTILNATDLHASTGKSTESRLGAGSGGLSTVTTSGSQLDVEGSDSESLDLLGNILCGQHSSVGRSLITISLPPGVLVR